MSENFPDELQKEILRLEKQHKKSLEIKIKAIILKYYRKNKIIQYTKNKISIKTSLEQQIALNDLIESLARVDITLFKVKNDKTVIKRFITQSDVVMKGLSFAISNIRQHGIEIIPGPEKVNTEVVNVKMPVGLIKEVKVLVPTLSKKNRSITKNDIYAYAIKLGIIHYKYQIHAT